MLWFALGKPQGQTWTGVTTAGKRHWAGTEECQVCGIQGTNDSAMLVSMGKVLKSPETLLSAPESLSPLNPAHPTLHRQQHCALHHAMKSIPSKMGHAFVLLSAKSRKLQVTLTVAGPEQSLLNGSLENSYPLQNYPCFSKTFSGIT